MSLGQLFVGPVIGKVTSNSARILAEFNVESQITARLTDPEGNFINSTIQVLPRKPSVFKFNNLNPRTKYQFFIDGFQHVTSSFRTLDPDLSSNSPGISFAVVSGNNTAFRSSKMNLWSCLYNKITRNEINYLLHIGGNVYMDSQLNNLEGYASPYRRIAMMLENIPRDDWLSRIEDVLEILRDQVRKTWNERETALVLANVPNLMMFDDHDIRDDWGFREADSNPFSEKIDYFYGQCARRVYYEYQRQLREDVNLENLQAIDREFFCEVLSGIGVYFLDVRGVRTWHNATSGISRNKYLGSQQLIDIESTFSPQGLFGNVKGVIFVCPMPLVLLTESISKVSKHFVDDAVQDWSHNHKAEQAQLLNILKDWKGADFGRELEVVSGNVNIGGITEIFYHKTRIFNQMICSSINQKEKNGAEFWFVKKVLHVQHDLKNGYGFEHHDWTNHNNFGIVRVGMTDMNDCRIVSKLTYLAKEGFVESPYFDNTYVSQKNMQHCCNIF